MSRRSRSRRDLHLAVASIAALWCLNAAAAWPESTAQPTLATVAGTAIEGTQRARETGISLPLHFEANVGQTDPRVRFLARGSGYILFLTASEAVLALRQPIAALEPMTPPHAAAQAAAELTGAVLRMEVIGASRHATIEGRQELAGKSHYLVGNDASRWRRDIQTYAQVYYRTIYPGIDAVFYGREGKLEYDFVVNPGADPGHIHLAYRGAEALQLDAAGDLVLQTTAGPVRLQRPEIYQEVAGVRKPVAGGYRLEEGGTVGFEVAVYDPHHPLVIDPVLSYSTYLGGSGGDGSRTMAVDAAGNAYVAGTTASVDFPTESPFQSSPGGGGDAFISKLNPAGTALVYSTYLGGAGLESFNDIVVDDSGAVYATGLTSSTNYPTERPLQDTYGGGPLDAVVTKLNASGSALVFSTYLGGSGQDLANGIAIDGSGAVYVSGRTSSSDLATTPGAFQTAFGGVEDAFFAKLNAAGTAFVYFTYLGGTGNDFARRITVDGGGNLCVEGRTASTDFPTTARAFQTAYGGGPVDAFAAKLSPTGAHLVYSTYLGGSGEDEGSGIGLDRAGRLHIAGWTGSADFPTTAGAFQSRYGGGPLDVFVTKLNVTGSALIYSTFLGGAGRDSSFFGLTLDRFGNAHVSGDTTSDDFPLARPIQSVRRGGTDAFVTKIQASGARLVYSTYLGGSGTDVAQGMEVDRFGDAYVSGTTGSADFPTVSAVQPAYGGGVNDAFVAKLSDRVAVGIDIKPGSWPNSVNLRSRGTVPVAILSTPTFDAATVDPTTVTVAEAAVALSPQGRVRASMEDVNGDGLLDLVVHVPSHQLRLEDDTAIVLGQTFDARSIAGADTVRRVP